MTREILFSLLSMRTKRSNIGGSVVVAVFLLFSSSQTGAGEKPNIVFILADDLGWADTTLYGHTSLYETPHLERLAGRGMTFDRAYTASPLCSPTRASILTGLHPARTGLTAPNCHTPKLVLKATAGETAPPNRKLTAYSSVTRLDRKYETISERLQSERWATAHFGKWHLGAEPYSPLEHGFDLDIPHWHGPGPAGSFVAPWKFPAFKEKYPKEHIEDRMGDEAVAFMETHKDEPFFLNYWQFSVHAPFDAKPDLIAKYRKMIDPNDEQHSPTYAAMVQSLDENVGKMLDALDRLGIADRTIIVFYSDNGGNMYNEVDGTTPTSNRPLRGGKANSWDGGTRVPAIVVWPGVTEGGSKSHDLITSTDFYPTFLEMTGLKPTEEQTFDGISIVPALKGATLDRDRIYTFFPHSTKVPDTLPPSAAVYEGDWKLFRFLHDGPGGAHRHALYHLGRDIGERNDLASSEPERVAAMSVALDKFLSDTKAVYPKANPDYDPSLSIFAAKGWKSQKGCAFSVVGNHVKVTTEVANANFTIKLAPPVGPGNLTMRLRIKSDKPGNIHLRWEEKRVKPVYHSDRLIRDNSYPENQWKTLDIPFSAKNPVASFRVNFMQLPGTVLIENATLLRESKVLRNWKFADNSTAEEKTKDAESAVWQDLDEQFRRARKSNPRIKQESLSAGSERRDGIFQHAEGPGQPLATFIFPPYTFPRLGKSIDGIKLGFSIAFKDGDAFVDAKSDGCVFIITANGEDVYRKEYAEQKWKSEVVDLTRFAGKEVTLKFQVDPRSSSAADWASWSDLKLWLSGDLDAIEQQLKTATSMPEYFPIEKLKVNRQQPDRVYRSRENVHIAVLDEHLDLATATERLSREIGPAKVPLAPRLVVGEGAAPDNHTLVKVLGHYGIPELQFLAYPPTVRGGVYVESIGSSIAATPIQDGQVLEVSLFDQLGNQTGKIEPDFPAPFVLVSGDFLKAPGEELVIASAVGGRATIYSEAGQPLMELMIPQGKTKLSNQQDTLLVYTDEHRLLNRFDWKGDRGSERKLSFLPPGRSVFASAFSEKHLWAGGPQPLLSHVYDIKPDDTYVGRNVGQEENQFWIALPKEFEADLGRFEGKTKAKHIRLATYGHIRVDAMSPRYENPDNGTDFAGPAFLKRLRQIHALKPLNARVPMMWNPAFTHRQFRHKIMDWARQTDPETGLNRNMMQSQLGRVSGMEALGEKGHISTTYAPGNESMQRLYSEPLRAFLQNWAPLYRKHPALVPSIEPHHEFESVVAADQSVGDYNPYMISGFYDWLVRRHGDDPVVWERALGVRFDEFFDAPRGLGRASWDRYSIENPFLRAWIDFNRYVINRSLAIGYRESLLAGIPPEMIRCHQIPDTYAVPPLLKTISRITPIDYAMTTGVGFGFTKFGVNHSRPDGNIVTATQTSGFDSFVMGEFQPLSTDSEIVEKELRFVFNSGAKAIHPLYWGTNHTGRDVSEKDRAFNQTLHDALQQLILDDPARPGQAGGIGQVRAYDDGSRKFNIVSIGTGKQHTGLLKSVRSDGSMEGTVYCIPFHQHIRVTPLHIVNQKITINDPIAPGSQIEIVGSGSKVDIRIFRHGAELSDLGATLSGNVRYTLRLPERIDGLTIQVISSDFKPNHATLQQPDGGRYPNWTSQRNSASGWGDV